MNCQHILYNNENTSQKFTLFMSSSELAIFCKGHFGKAVEKSVFEDNHNVDQWLLVSLKICLNGELVKET